MLCVSCPASLCLSAGCNKKNVPLHFILQLLESLHFMFDLYWFDCCIHGKLESKTFSFFFHMDIYHNENTASCLEWILEPISKISWLHLCISISRLTILFPVADACFFIHCLGVTTSQSQKCGMLFIRLYSFSTVLENSTSFVFLLQKKKILLILVISFNLTHEFEN